MTEESTKVEDSKIFIGYHGTNKESADAILETNFKFSNNPDDWLGYGIYFFVEGISNPINNATEWAKNKAWNGGGASLLYSSYAILSAEVGGKNVLDTNKKDDLIVFNEVRELLLETHDQYWQKDRRLKNDNRILWNLVADFLEIEIIIHNLYIKTKQQRIKRIDSNVPNVTVMCVKDVKNINIDTIKKEKVGEVEL